uniref:Secreted protein n=1 Tax=Anguilla anguilla TaxID=7936 RepID=A0A0E9XLL9_ANGAN
MFFLVFFRVPCFFTCVLLSPIPKSTFCHYLLALDKIVYLLYGTAPYCMFLRSTSLLFNAARGLRTTDLYGLCFLF